MTCPTLAEQIRRLLAIYPHMALADLASMIAVHSCQTCRPTARHLARDPEDRP